MSSGGEGGTGQKEGMVHGDSSSDCVPLVDKETVS